MTTSAIPLLCMSLASRAEPPVLIEAAPAERPAVRISAAAGEVRIPDCRAIVWERFEPADSSWRPLVSPACGPMGPALEVGAEGRVFEADVDLTGATIVRAVAVVGVGCKAGPPFPYADCAQIMSVAGPTIPVKGAGKP